MSPKKTEARPKDALEVFFTNIQSGRVKNDVQNLKKKHIQNKDRIGNEDTKLIGIEHSKEMKADRKNQLNEE